jgi:hypothetical protein
MQGGTLGVVDVDGSGTQARPVEQRGLGLPVGLHAGVIVQVVLREVGEHRHRNARAHQPVLGQADGGGLDGARARPGIGKLPEGALQQHRVRRGHARGLQAPGKPHTQSTHQGTWAKR